MNLAFGHCKGISLAVVCTSAEKYSRNLRGFAEDKLTYCDGSVLKALDEKFLDVEFKFPIKGRMHKFTFKSQRYVLYVNFQLCRLFI